MSCIRFNTPAQRRQMAAAAPRMLSSEEAEALRAVEHPAPEVTDSKIRRLRLLAADANPRIREAAAASYHTPEDVRARLAKDPVASVRACVAKNETTPCDLLRELADDEDATVRGWVAVNYFVPEDVMGRLAEDADATVRGLVAWKDALRAEAEAEQAVAV